MSTMETDESTESVISPSTVIDKEIITPSMFASVKNEEDAQSLMRSLRFDGYIEDSEIDDILRSNFKEIFLTSLVELNHCINYKNLTENVKKFMDNISLELWTNLINLSAEREFFKIYQELKKLEVEYERSVRKESSPSTKKDYDYKNVLDDISKLHEHIIEYKIDEIKDFIIKYPKLKLCKDSSNVSALEKSIEARQFKIYFFLYLRGFYSEYNRDQNKIKKLNENEKKILGEEVLKNELREEILKQIVERRHLTILELLTQNRELFMENVDCDLWEDLIVSSAEKEFFEIFGELKNLEGAYKQKLNEDFRQSSSKCSKRRKIVIDYKYEYKNILDDLSRFHIDITEGKIDEVEKFIEKYPKLKLCYNCVNNFSNQNNCALESAIDAKRFKIYALLEAKGFKADDDHRLKIKRMTKDTAKVRKDNRLKSFKIGSLNSEEKDMIRNEKLNYAFINQKYFVDLVYQNCVLDCSSDENFFTEIRKMLETLYKIKELKPIIEILALSDVKIIFDPNNETVENADPTRSACVYGVTYGHEGKIYVSKNINTDLMRGTFAHEVTHYVLYLIYENNYLPFRPEDKEREKIYENVVETTRKICENNPNNHSFGDIVRRVFYDERTQSKELIVRVNHVLAAYHGNNKKLEEYKKLYPELFAFYESCVMPELTKDFYEVIKLNNNFGLLEAIRSSKFHVKDNQNVQLLNLQKNVQSIYENFNEGTSSELEKLSKLQKKLKINNFLLYSNIPQLTLSKLFKEISHGTVSKVEVNAKNIFINFERLKQENLKNQLEKVLSSSTCKKRGVEILRIIIFLDVDAKLIETLKVDETLKFLNNLTSSVLFFLVVSSSCSSICKPLSKLFTIDESKFEIENDNLKIIDGNSEACENVQDNLKFLRVNLKHFTHELSQKSIDEVLRTEFKFRNESFSLESLLPQHTLPSAEILKIVISQIDFEIKTAQAEILKIFIERKFVKRSENSKPARVKRIRKKYIESEEEEDEEGDEFLVTERFSKIGKKSRKRKIGETIEFVESLRTIDEFIKDVKNESIVVISDLAGSGKTTLLHKIHETLNEKYPNFWICFVSLKDHKELLSSQVQVCDNFVELMTTKILKLNEIERKVFELKYSLSEVVILFDGFDEISPDGKESALKIFKLHKENEQSRIWITTRSHLEVDLENELDVKSHSILPLTETEQVEFLCQFWAESGSDSLLIRKCAKLLVQKISKIVKNNPSLIGITLQVRILGEYFQYKLSKNFAKKIKNLKFSHVYEFLISKSINFKEPNSMSNNAKCHEKFYQALALKIFFDDENHHLFGLSGVVEDFEERDDLEELTRDGIIFYDKNKKVYFNHLTYGEFFVPRFIKIKVKNFKNNWKHSKDFCKLIKRILNEIKFGIIRRFLDDSFEELLENFDKQESIKLFAESFTNLISEEDEEEICDWMNTAVSFGISHFLLFIFKCIRNENFSVFKIIVESRPVQSSAVSFLSNSVLKINEPKILKKFLDEVFSIYSSNSELFNILIRKNVRDRTIFHEIVMEWNFKPEIFKIFWVKIEERNFDYENVSDFFFCLDDDEKTFLDYAIKDYSEKQTLIERIDAVLETIDKNLIPEDRKRILDQVGLNCKIYEKIFLRNLNFLRKAYTLDEILTARFMRSENFISALENVIDSHPNNSELFVYLMSRDGLGRTTFHKLTKSVKIFEKIWSKIAEKSFEYSEVCEIFFAQDINGKNFFHFILSMAINEDKTAERIGSILNIAQNNLKIEDQRKLITEINFHEFGYLKIAQQLLQILEFSCQIFECDEMIEKLCMEDENGRTIWHYAAEYSSSQVLKIIVKKFKKLIEEKGENVQEKMKKFMLKKYSDGQNVLMFAVKEQNFQDIFKNVFLKFLSLEDFIYEVDENGWNIFHFLCRYGNCKKMTYFLNRLKAILSTQELKNFLRIKTNDSKNVFHLLVSNEYASLVRFVFKFFKHNFEIEEVKEILLPFDSNLNKIPLHELFIQNNQNIFKIYFNFYLAYFTKVEILKFLFMSDRNGENIFSVFQRNEMFSNVINLLFRDAKVLTEEAFELFPNNSELFDFFLHKGLWNGGTVFHFIVSDQNFNLECFTKLWDQIEKRKFENISESFWFKNQEGEFFFQIAIETIIKERDASDERINAVINVLKRNLEIEDQRKILKALKFYQLGTFEHKRPLLRVLEFLHEVFENDKILELFSLRDEEWRETIWHKAARHSTPKVLKIIYEEFHKIFEEKNENLDENLKKFVLKGNKWNANILMLAVLQQNFKNFCYILDELFPKFLTFKEIALEVDENGSNVLHFLAYKGTVEMAEHLLNQAQKEFSIEEFKNFLKTQTKKSQNVFHLIAWNKDKNAVNFFINFYSKLISHEEIKKLLRESNIFGDHPLRMAAHNKSEVVFQSLFDFYKKIFTVEEILEFFSLKDEKWGETIWHRAARLSTSKVLKRIYEEFRKIFAEKTENHEEKLKKFVLKGNKENSNILMLAVLQQNFKNFCYILDELFPKFLTFKEIALEVDENGSNVLHFLAYSGTVEMVEHFLNQAQKEFSTEEFKNFLKTQTKKSQNVFHLIALNEDENVVEFFLDFYSKFLSHEEIKKLLKESNLFGHHPLRQAAKNWSEDVFQLLFDFYKKYFTNEKFFELFSLKDEELGETIWHQAARHSTPEVLRKIYEEFQIKFEEKNENHDENLKKFVFKGNKENQNILMLAALQNNFNNFCYILGELFPKFLTFKEITLEVNEDGWNVLHCLADSGTVEMAEYFSNQAQKEFSTEEFKNFLKTQTKESQNVFHLIAWNKDKNVVEFFLDFYSKFLSHEEIKKLLKETNNSGYFPLCDAANNGSEDVFQSLFDFYKKCFTTEEILELFSLRDEESGETIWHQAARHSTPKILKSIYEKFQKTFEEKNENCDEENLKKFVLKGNKWNQNILMLAVLQQNFNNFCYILDELFPKFLTFKEIAFKVDEDGWNVLHFLAYSGTVEMAEHFLNQAQKEFSTEEFKNFLKTQTKKSQNVFHLIAWNIDENVVEFFLDFYSNIFSYDEIENILKKANNFGDNPLRQAANNNSEDAFQSLFDFYKKYFTTEEFFELLSLKDEEWGETIWHDAARHSTPETLKLIFEEFHKIFAEKTENHEEDLKKFVFKGNKWNANILMLAVLQKNFNNFCYILDELFPKFSTLKEIALVVDENSSNVLHFLAESGTVEMAEYFLNKAQKEFSTEEFKNFLKTQTKKSQNVFHLIVLNEDKSAIKLFLDFYSKYLSNEEIKIYLKESDSFGDHPLHDAANNNSEDVLQSLFDFYKKYFTAEEILEILEDKGSYGMNVIDICQANEKEELIRNFLEKYNEALSSSEENFDVKYPDSEESSDDEDS